MIFNLSMLSLLPDKKYKLLLFQGGWEVWSSGKDLLYIRHWIPGGGGSRYSQAHPSHKLQKLYQTTKHIHEVGNLDVYADLLKLSVLKFAVSDCIGGLSFEKKVPKLYILNILR